MNDCKQCEALAHQLAETEKKLAKVEKELDDALKIIKAIGKFARGQAVSAASKMRKGNIGRAEYGWSHAEFDFGNAILGILNEPQIKLKKKFKGVLGFGQGLFEGIFGE